MAYVLTDGGNSVVTYPYSIGLLRRDNPNVSFPASPTEAQLADWNVFPVAATDQPAYDLIDELLTEAAPSFVLGGWVQQWSVTAASAEQAAATRASFEASARDEAVSLLRASDVYVVESAEFSKPLHPEYVAYRAALRSPETLPGFPVSTQFPPLPTINVGDVVDLPDEFTDAIN